MTDTVTGWLAAISLRELVILFGLVLALGLSVFRWVQARREARAHARAERALRQRLEGVERAADAIAVLGPGEKFVYANAAAARTFGYRASRELFGKPWRLLFSEEEAERLAREVLPDFRRRGTWVGEVRARRRDGTTFPLELSMARLDGGAATWVARDGAWRGEAEESLRDREDRFRSVIHAAGSVIVLLDSEGRVREWNREAERVFGLRRHEALGEDFVELVAAEGQRRTAIAELEAARADQGTRTFELAAAGGDRRMLLWRVTSLENTASALAPADPSATLRHAVEGAGPATQAGGGDGTAEEPPRPGAALVAVGHDVTGRRQAEEALHRHESLYRLLANNSTDLVALHDPEGSFLYVSPSCGSLLGYRQEDVVGRDAYRLAHSDDWKRLQTALVAARAGRLHRTELRFRSATGEYVWFEMLIRPIRDDSGRVIQLQSSSRDISERKTFEQQLEHQALHEPLTGLPNRTLFMDRLRQALARAKREGSSVAVMFMDLDRFKVINDSLGHAAGDRLLVAVARRIRACLREADTVARLGGDEFAFLLEFNIAQRDAGTVADRVLEQLQPPFTFAGNEVFITASIGIAFSSPHVQTPEDLLRYADVAMFRAKDEGPGNWRVYDPAVDDRATRRLEMETALRRALEREELAILYQPIVSLSTGRITGMEALVRWRQQDRGLVGPDEFIPLAEESGLIVPMGEWIMRRACEEAVIWDAARGEDDPPLLVSVNLSNRQFEVATLERDVEEILRQTGLPAARLQLEITETELIQNSGRISALKELGVRLAIDDFGTGYSSLGYLRNLPVDVLKVDRTFVQGLPSSPEDTAIVRTVITLAHALGLEVTAEGVETEEQLARLRELECSGAQGYHFSRPLEVAAAREMIASAPRW